MIAVHLFGLQRGTAVLGDRKIVGTVIKQEAARRQSTASISSTKEGGFLSGGLVVDRGVLFACAWGVTVWISPCVVAQFMVVCGGEYRFARGRRQSLTMGTPQTTDGNK